MAIGTPLNNPYWLSQLRPLDGKTYFESLDEACGPEIGGIRSAGHLVKELRAKGLKFVIREDNNGEPAEYWFIEDYKPSGYTTPPVGPPHLWPPPDIPEVIPQPVPYQASGGECTHKEDWVGPYSRFKTEILDNLPGLSLEDKSKYDGVYYVKGS